MSVSVFETYVNIFMKSPTETGQYDIKEKERFVLIFQTYFSFL